MNYFIPFCEGAFFTFTLYSVVKEQYI
jgi:hypothetical protein